MIRITVPQAVRIHFTVCQAPLIEYGKLEGALYAPHQSFEGQELHPTMAGKAARYVEAINTAHAFLDGNKRLSWLTCVEFLELNALELVDIPAHEIDSTIRAMVRHNLTLEDFRSWIEDKIDL